MKRKIFVLLMSFILIFTMAATVSAKTVEEIEEEEKELKAEMNELTDKIEEKQKILDDVQAELDVINARISENETRITNIMADITATERSISGQESNLGLRLRNMYKNGTVGFIDVILNSSDIADFINNMSLVQRIYQNDSTILDELEEKRDQLMADKIELEKAKSELVLAQEDLAAKEVEAQKAKDDLQAEKDKLQEKVNELEAEAQKLRAQTNSAGQQSNYEPPEGGTGQLLWPCDTHIITGYFGWRTYPWSEFHEGMDIGCSYGENIYAAADGQVTVAGWYGGYGYCVCIYHGNGMSTLYGHNSSINCSVGQIVSRGQVVAFAGSTGWSTGVHCHFEVQINGTPVDPLGYL